MNHVAAWVDNLLWAIKDILKGEYHDAPLQLGSQWFTLEVPRLGWRKVDRVRDQIIRDRAQELFQAGNICRVRTVHRNLKRVVYLVSPY